MYRILFFALVTADLLWDALLFFLRASQKDKPLPENVRDVYDPAAYAKWRAYAAEKSKLSAAEKVFDYLVLAGLFLTPVLARVYDALPGGELVRSVLLLVGYTLLLTLLTVPFDWVRTMKIETKYGFNKSTPKTFVLDELKDFAVNAALNAGLFLFIHAMYKAFGVRFFWSVYAGVAVLILVFSLLSTTFQKLYNKFTPLGEGELRDRLTALFSSSGYRLEDIYVMDASRRTTKANAFCSGLGPQKKIVLYDNLVERYTPGEIAAVFSHELGHYKRRDTLKNTLYTLFLAAVVTASMVWFAMTPAISLDYGFAGMSVVFGVIAMQTAALPLLLRLLMIPQAAISRRFEYKADAEAVKQGYGEELISALKKLGKDNFSDLNPHPFEVATEHSHPTLSDRIRAVRAEEKTG